jgi:hypothetical protein
MGQINTVEDICTRVLHGLVFGQITGVAVDFDKETGEKYYGLRIDKVFSSQPPVVRHYVLWFVSDEEGNGPGFFQLQEGFE